MKVGRVGSLLKYSQDQPRDEQGKFIEVGTLKEVKTSVWKGKAVEVQTGISKQNVGKLGERIVLQYMKQQGYSDARPLNTSQSNFPVDMVQDHAAIEVKAGLVSNGESAQHWRATIGQPGPTEAVWLANADKEEKQAWNEAKAAQILDRKNQVVKDLSKKLGHKVQGTTMTCIINPDTRTTDLFKFKGFHLRIGWNAPETQRAYVGTFKY
jgi:hypothetical protein